MQYRVLIKLVYMNSIHSATKSTNEMSVVATF